MVKAYVISRLTFSISLFSNLSQFHLAKIHKLIMACGRFIRGSYGYMVNTQTILTDANLLNFRQLVFTRICQDMFNIISLKEPRSLYEMLKFPNRACKQISFKVPPQTSRGSQLSIFYSNLKIFNKLPDKLKTIQQKSIFMRELRKLVSREPSWDWVRGSQQPF